MELGYSNDMINSTIGRMTREHRVKFFWHFSVIQKWKKWEGFKKVGVAGGVHFPWVIIFLMTS